MQEGGGEWISEEGSFEAACEMLAWGQCVMEVECIFWSLDLEGKVGRDGCS